MRTLSVMCENQLNTQSLALYQGLSRDLRFVPVSVEDTVTKMKD